MGKYEANIKCCEFAFDWFDDMSDEYKCIFLFNSALCNIKLEEYEKALEKLTILEPTIKKVNIDKYYEVVGQKAVCLQYLKRYDESIKIYFSLLRFIDKYNYEKYTMVLINMTEIYIALGETDKAKEHLNIILPNITKIGTDSQHLAGLYYELGKIFKDFEDFIGSEKYLLKSLSLAKKQTYYFLMKEVIFELIYIYNKNSEIEKIVSLKTRYSY